MKFNILIPVLLIMLLIFVVGDVSAWTTYSLPKVIAGGSVGYFRISLDNFDRIYKSRWDNIYAAHANIRFYRSNYLTVQMENYENGNFKATETTEGASWRERFINVGVRWYPDIIRKWNFYSGLGLTFIEISEKPGLSVFENDPSDKHNGSGFFFELGADFMVLSHLAVFMEMEITSAGKGGTPGFVGSSLGGFAFQTGIDIYF